MAACVNVRSCWALALLAATFAFVASVFPGAAFAQCLLPYTLTNGQIADASQVMANFNALATCLSPGGPTNSLQYNAGGSLGGVPLTNGQLLIGRTGQPPQARALTAGSGISITNGAGSVTIAATGTEAGNGLIDLRLSIFCFGGEKYPKRYPSIG